jgi:hypothetical protein
MFVILDVVKSLLMLLDKKKEKLLKKQYKPDIQYDHEHLFEHQTVVVIESYHK